MIDLKQVGERIAAMRTCAELTQTQLAEQLHVSHQAVSKWENAHSLPDAEYLISLARIFKTTIEFILTGDSEPSTDFRKDDLPPVDLDSLVNLAPLMARELVDRLIRSVDVNEALRAHARSIFVPRGTAFGRL